MKKLQYVELDVEQKGRDSYAYSVVFISGNILSFSYGNLYDVKRTALNLLKKGYAIRLIFKTTNGVPVSCAPELSAKDYSEFLSLLWELAFVSERL